MKSYVADSIAKDYEKKKRYEMKRQKKELQKFIDEKCSICKNNKTQLCHIVKNMDNKISCPFIEI